MHRDNCFCIRTFVVKPFCIVARRCINKGRGLWLQNKVISSIFYNIRETGYNIIYTCLWTFNNSSIIDVNWFNYGNWPIRLALKESLCTCDHLYLDKYSSSSLTNTLLQLSEKLIGVWSLYSFIEFTLKHVILDTDAPLRDINVGRKREWIYQS